MIDYPHLFLIHRSLFFRDISWGMKEEPPSRPSKPIPILCFSYRPILWAPPLDTAITLKYTSRQGPTLFYGQSTQRWD
jgi:hypothetical protein